MPPEPLVRSRRERPSKPALSRAGIVAAALDLLDRDGAERVTMRRLATELDTGPASLYVYVRSSDDLHAAVLDSVLGAGDLSPRADAAPEEQLVDVLVAYTRCLMARPGLARTAVLVRPSGPHYLDLLERLLDLLDRAGVPPDRAAWAVDVLLQQATATAAEQGDRPGGSTVQDEALRSAVLGASPAAHPRLARAGADLFSGAGPDRLAWGLRVLVRGALATPRPAPPAPEP